MSHLTIIPVNVFDNVNLDDRNELHRKVMSMFDTHLPGPAAARRATNDILFRVEDDTHLLIRSAAEPVNLPAGGQTRESPAVHLPAGTPVRFRITVNAVTRVNGKQDRPVSDVTAWLTARLEPAFTNVDVFNTQTEDTRRGKSPLRLQTVDGFASINNMDAVNGHLQHGIGRSKAYGAGMLTIALA